MKKIYIQFFIYSLLCGYKVILQAQTSINVSPFISSRPQGMNTVQYIQGISNYLHRQDNTKQGVFLFHANVTYNKSNKSGRIADNLFGTIVHGTKWDIAELSIRGSAVENRNVKKDLLADYFGLPKDFYSRVSLQPIVNNIVLNLSAFFNIYTSKLWFYCNLPIAYSNWNLHYKELVVTKGSSNYQPGYFNSMVTFGTSNENGSYPNASGVNRNKLLTSFADYISYKKSIDLGMTATNKNITFEPLKFAGMLTTQESKKNSFGLADFHMILAYDPIQQTKTHLTLGLYAIIPTGTRVKGDYTFEPTLGNNHHFELGTHLSSRYQLSYNPHTQDLAAIYGIFRILHPFSTEQRRTFDLKEKPSSRYMLAQKMTSGTNLFVNTYPGNISNSSLSSLQFDNAFAPIANLTTLDVSVSIPWHIDATFFLHFESNNITYDIGYNLWARGPEKIKLQSNSNRITNEKWALKGDAQVYGFSQSTVAPETTPIALAGVEPYATITQGTNNFISTNTNEGGCDNTRPTRNPGIINPKFSRTASEDVGNNATINDRPDNLGLQIKSSQPPICITLQDIDITGAQVRNLSHSFFAGFSIQFPQYSLSITPYIACAGQAEFHAVSHIKEPPSPQLCTTQTYPQPTSGVTRTCGLSQWHIWIEVGAYLY